MKTYEVTNLKTNEVTETKRFHYQLWEDHCAIPTEELSNLALEIESAESPTGHCKAGIGRTMTAFTATDLLAKARLGLIKEDNVDSIIDETALKMREARGPNAIQTAEQRYALVQLVRHWLKEGIPEPKEKNTIPEPKGKNTIPEPGEALYTEVKKEKRSESNKVPSNTVLDSDTTDPEYGPLPPLPAKNMEDNKLEDAQADPASLSTALNPEPKKEFESLQQGSSPAESRNRRNSVSSTSSEESDSSGVESAEEDDVIYENTRQGISGDAMKNLAQAHITTYDQIASKFESGPYSPEEFTNDIRGLNFTELKILEKQMKKAAGQYKYYRTPYKAVQEQIKTFLPPKPPHPNNGSQGLIQPQKT